VTLGEGDEFITHGATEFACFIFSSLSCQGGRAAAWATALGVVAAWSWYENRDNGQIFSKEEQQKWNSQKDPKTGKST
jgi:hypothetical protein